MLLCAWLLLTVAVKSLSDPVDSSAETPLRYARALHRHGAP